MAGGTQRDRATERSSDRTTAHQQPGKDHKPSPSRYPPKELDAGHARMAAMPLTLTRRFSAVVMVGLTGAAPAVAQTPVAARNASVSQVSSWVLGPAACDDKPKEYILKYYSVRAPYPPAPLRCGTSTFGFIHLKERKRWDSEFDRSIQNTLLLGREGKKDGTSVTFVKEDLPPCPGHFRVVVEYKAYASGDQGIITAYHSDDPFTLSAEQSPQGHLAKQSSC